MSIIPLLQGILENYEFSITSYLVFAQSIQPYELLLILVRLHAELFLRLLKSV